MRNIRKRKIALVKVVDEIVIKEKDKKRLPEKLGDCSFGLFMALSVALFAEYILKGATGISNEILAISITGIIVALFSGIIFYRKGGL
ncbi:MAG: hypothetical protein FWE23_08360 [Chitinivibrionia bacterium]|nr:hypothetical protein [Chitinivibrionia bacterium]